MMIESALVFLMAVFIASVSQVILKWAAMRSYPCWWQCYWNYYVISAYGGLAISTLMSLWAYRALPLSMGTILETTCYFYAALFGKLFFGERLTRRKVMGLVLIAGGICVYAFAG